jgi:thioredoxin-like negative regulator of GroEL
LLLAAAFSALFNLSLISAWVWPEIFIWDIKVGLWLTTSVGWLVMVAYQFRAVTRVVEELPVTAPNQDALFIQAQTEYLKGNWDESEWLLRQRLSTAPRDVESRLLLLTTYRRKGQPEKAFEQLRFLRKLDDALEWQDELERETRYLELMSESTEVETRVDLSAEYAHGSTEPAATDMIDSNRVRRAA